MPVKRDDVRRMFDAIAPTYDVLNRVLSFGIDGYWRKRLMWSIGPIHGYRALDIACGTGDLLLALSKERPGNLVGFDLAPEMLRRARVRLGHAGVEVNLVCGAAESLPFGDDAFDVITVAFGVRNFEDLAGALREMRRVLRSKGQLRILEFAPPRNGVWGSIFSWYFMSVVPTIGRWISGHPHAYNYLPSSVVGFHDAATLAATVREAGFTVITNVSLTGGVVTLTVAEA